MAGDTVRLKYLFVEGVATFTGTLPTTRLLSQFTEVVGFYSNLSTDVPKTRLRSAFSEVVAYYSNTGTDPKKTRLRYNFIEVIAPADSGFQPQVMICT